MDIMMRLFFVFLFVGTFFYAQDGPVMAWNENYELQWSDFRAEPQPRGDEIAVTASGLTFGYSVTRFSKGGFDYSFEVTAHFYPEKSWGIKELVNDNTLAHERLHFDITELHARKFRKRVKETRFSSNIDAEMERINIEINQQLRAMQKLYDKETSHSRYPEKQGVWQEYVKSELEKLRNFR